MSDYNEMYKLFNLDENKIKNLNKLASKQYPFDEKESSILIHTVTKNGDKEVRKEEGIINAKLV